MSQQFDRGVKLASALWILLFAFLLLFVVAVAVWAIAGPGKALTIFAVAIVLFVIAPLLLARRGRQ